MPHASHDVSGTTVPSVAAPTGPRVEAALSRSDLRPLSGGMALTMPIAALLMVSVAVALAATGPSASPTPPCLAPGIGIEGLFRWDCHEPWQAYHDSDAGFSIEVCGAPQLAVQIESSDRRTPWHEVSLSGIPGARVAFRDVIPGPMTAEEYLDQAVAEMLRETIGLRIKASRPIHDKVGVGREVDFSSPVNGEIVRARFLIGDDRVHRIVVQTSPESVDCHLVQRFLTSLRLGATPANAIPLPRDEGRESRRRVLRFLGAWAGCTVLLAICCFWQTRLRLNRRAARSNGSAGLGREADEVTIRLRASGAMESLGGGGAIIWTVVVLLALVVGGALTTLILVHPLEGKAWSAMSALILFGLPALMKAARALRWQLILNLAPGRLLLASSFRPSPYGISGVIDWNNVTRLGVHGRCVGVVLRDVGAFLTAQSEADLDTVFRERWLSRFFNRHASRATKSPVEALADNERRSGFHLLIPASSYPGKAPQLLARLEEARRVLTA